MSGVVAWLNVILACAPGVHPTTVQGIMQHESGGRAFAIGVNHGAAQLPEQPDTLNEAVAAARRLRAKGINFDAGLMQINSANWSRLGLTPENVFDPCTNVRAGATILTENYVAASKRHGPGQRALLEALSIYNTGNRTAGFANGYVAKVSRQAARIAGLPARGLPPIPPRTAQAGTTAVPPRGGVAPASAWQTASVWGQQSPASGAPIYTNKEPAE